MAACDTHTLAVDRGGNIWAWGANGRGQLGDGAEVRQHNPDRLTPAKVVGIDKVVAVAGHGWQSLALKAAGTVWEWGVRWTPDHIYPTTSIPVQVKGLSRITAISSGGGFHIALRDDGTAWSWGVVHWCGQLGCGPLDEKPIDWGTLRQVKDVTPFNDVIAISAGTKHGLLLRADGSVWAWGGNEFDCLGIGTTGNRLVPTRVQKFESTGKDSFSVMAFDLFHH